MTVEITNAFSSEVKLTGEQGYNFVERSLGCAKKRCFG